jgi:hypothetical protein
MSYFHMFCDDGMKLEYTISFFFNFLLKILTIFVNFLINLLIFCQFVINLLIFCQFVINLLIFKLIC